MSTTTNGSGIRASLPHHWKLVALGDHCEHSLGKMLDRQKNEGVSRPYLRNPNVKWFGFDLTDVKEMPIKDSEKDKYSVRPGDVIVCEGGEAGRAAIWNGEAEEMYIQKALHRVRVGPELHNRYLVYVLMADAHSGHLSSYFTGTTIPHFTGQDLHRYTIPLPPLSEQKRIADILDKADAIRRKRQEAINVFGDLTAAVFNDMFSEQLTSVDWTDLGDFVEELRYGTSNKSGETGFTTLRIPNVVRGIIDLGELKTVRVSDNEFENLKLIEDDLLFVRTNGNPDYVGRCAAFQPSQMEAAGLDADEIIYASYLIRARLKLDLLRPAFLQSFLQTSSGRRNVREKCRTSAGQYNINTKGIASLRVPKIPIDEQIEFEKRISASQPALTKLTAAESETNNLFNSLVQRAFKGEM